MKIASGAEDNHILQKTGNKCIIEHRISKIGCNAAFLHPNPIRQTRK
ncbi:MAG: hypothetical protein K2N34_01920 [Lachnospiraceae bacterium]|nr:hypothetical protein [Lachnospiraceae bacterium]